MVPHKVHVMLLASAILLATVIINVKSLPTSTGATTSLSIRDAGHVSVYDESIALNKRVNVALCTASVATFGGIVTVACAADIEPTTKAAICAIAVIGAVVSALAGVMRSLFGRDIDPRLSSSMVHHFPQIEGGQTTLSQLYRNYSGTPLLVAHSLCYDAGCHEVYYNTRLHSTSGKILHKLSVQPRRLPKSSNTTSKRQDSQASGQESDLYGDYLFINDNPTDEHAEGYDGSFPDNMERAADQDIFANTGIFCFNIEDEDDSGNYGSVGYIELSEPELQSDPNNEDAYINQCNNMH